MRPTSLTPSSLFIQFLIVLFSVVFPVYANAEVSTLQINFSGLSSVHTEVKVSDNLANSATGTTIKRVNWKNNSARIEVPKGVYDLIIRKGGGELIIDDVNCQLDNCTVDDIVATLTIKFPGLKNIHSFIHVSDGQNNSAGGDLVTSKKWKNEQVIVPVLRHSIDAIIQQGAAKFVVDNVDCSSGICSIDNLVANLAVNFPGMSSVNTSVHLTDQQAQSVTGEKVTHKNWKSDQALIPVLRGHYDLNISKGAHSFFVDAVDCTTATCQASDIVANLTVNFTGLNGVHTSVRLPDNVNHTANGADITSKKWQQDQTNVVVFRTLYDIQLSKGASHYVVDNIDCRRGHCTVENVSRILTINFEGISSAQTSVHLDDKQTNLAQGELVTQKKWQNNQAVLAVFPGVYDISVRKGEDSIVSDAVDCTSSNCTVNNLTAQLIVEFPGLNAMHTAVHLPDYTNQTAAGTKVAYQNWQADKAVITVFKNHYDVSVARKNAAPLIRDNVDCRSGSCKINDLLATLTVKFPGLNGVHTFIKEHDGQDNLAEGKEFTRKSWQNNEVILTVLKQKYDAIISTSSSAPIIIDNLDCTSGTCTVDQLTAILTVTFNGMDGIHTHVFNADGNTGMTTGKPAFKQNWQKNQAIISVFKQLYDVQVKNSHSEPILSENIDCRSGSCSVDNLTAKLTVDFNGMSNVHTAVHVFDNKPDVIEGGKVLQQNWQKNQAELTVFKQKYDVKIHRDQSENMLFEAIDCTSGTCNINQITAKLSINFAGLTGVHTSTHVPDNIANSAQGGKVTQVNWKTDKTEHTVFRQKYDVRVSKGSVSKIKDNIDCTSGRCQIDNLTSILSIDFPGLIGVHSSVHIPDNTDATATGSVAAKSNWKNQLTKITLLRETYDVKVKHGIESVFDNVDCNSDTCQLLIKGNVQTTLIDGDSNQPLPDVRLWAYEKNADGSLSKVMQGQTSPLGQINFTLPGVESGKIFVLKAYNPFKNNKSFFSPFISQAGVHQFIVTADGENTLDLTPPEITISSHQDGGSIATVGVNLTGSATDDREIERVEITVNDPVLGSQTLPGSYNNSLGTWSTSINSNIISEGQSLEIIARAFDKAQNSQATSINVSVVKDQIGPSITILSHQNNDDVPATGFLLSGSITDLTEITAFKASLTDSNLGQTLDATDLGFSTSNGAWTLIVENAFISEGSQVTINLTASDISGNQSTHSIQLNSIAVDYSTAQMINRITFGTTPELLNEVNSLGALAFLEQQLAPQNMDDSVFENTFRGNLPTTKEELQAWTLRHMIYSKRQLLEVMTWFWDNHFNTDINTRRRDAQGMEIRNSVAFELAENQAFRANALGNFSDLLHISAKSPAMLIYLDSISNVAGDSNENYAREVNELHTLGVDGGYSAQDVENGAEVFSGWHIQNGNFFFDDSQHSIGSYVIFAGTPQETIIPEGGVEQGEMLLDALARHPSTARYICGKLITLLVSDVPPDSLVIRCADEFQNNSEADNQIELVLRLILQSSEFNNAANYRSKIKSPVEYITGVIRSMDASTDASDLISPLRAMGIRLFENPVPTGWSELGEDWVNANLLIERIKWVNQFVRNTEENNGSIYYPMQFYPQYGFSTAEGIVGFLLQLTVGDDVTEFSRNSALNQLGSGFSIMQPNADQVLRQLNGNVMSYPQYQFQ